MTPEELQRVLQMEGDRQHALNNGPGSLILFVFVTAAIAILFLVFDVL